MYTATVISSTAVVYIEDSVSWGLGFGLSALVNLIGLVIFASGTHFYCRDKPQVSGNGMLSSHPEGRITTNTMMERQRRLLQHLKRVSLSGNRVPCTIKEIMMVSNSVCSLVADFYAALETEGDLKPDGSITTPWRLCTLQQVEDLKTTIRILPCWSSNLFISTRIAIQMSLTVLQPLKMDRHIGSHFNIPVGSVLVVVTMATYIALPVPIIDRILYRVWQKLTHNYHCDGPSSEVDLPVKLLSHWSSNL
ncbi:hypothetical protein ACFX15_006153 [Malus domestica]